MGGKINESFSYVGGQYEMLLVKKNVTYGGLRKMIFKLLTFDESVRKMKLNFETGHPFRPLYEVTDDRMWRPGFLNYMLTRLKRLGLKNLGKIFLV